jgi:hypothetical protein
VINFLFVAMAVSVPWSVYERSDPISDEKSVVVLTQQDGDALTITCSAKDKSWNILIMAESYVGSRPLTRDGVFRADEMTPVNVMYVTDAYVASIINNPPIARAMLNATSKVAFRVSAGRNSGDRDFVFTGMAKKVSAQFRQKCAAIGVPLD